MTGGLRMSEAQFTDAVVELAKYLGWQCAHFRPARTRDGWRTAMQGHKGFPDLVFARDGVVLFAELKVGGNQMTPEQEVWAAAIGPHQHYVWRPPDLQHEIPRILGRKATNGEEMVDRQ